MQIHIGISQALFIAFTSLGLAYSIKTHGRTVTETKNVLHAVIGQIIIYTLLITGGYFA